MKFEYKCPICRAKNILTRDNLSCRRCKSDLSSIYKTKLEKLYKLILMIAD